MRVLVIDGANVVGSRPDGWWHDRAGAARRLRDQLVDAELPCDEVVMVLEGAARRGIPAERRGGVRTVHALGSGDDTIVEQVDRHIRAGRRDIVVVTADRQLRDRVTAAGATAMGPGWLLGLL